MSKVAICFSGLPRMNFSITQDAWLKIIKKYNADVFVHTWILDKYKHEQVVERIKQVYVPKVVKCEASRSYPLERFNARIWPTVIPYNVFSAYASIYECMTLVNKYAKSNGIEYDYVVRARFDVLSAFQLEQVQGVAVPDDPDKHCLSFKYKDKELFGINDLLAYGSQKDMTLYSNTFYFLDHLYHVEGVDMCSELFLTTNLIRQGVNIEFKQMKTQIIRG